MSVICRSAPAAAARSARCARQVSPVSATPDHTSTLGAAFTAAFAGDGAACTAVPDAPDRTAMTPSDATRRASSESCVSSTTTMSMLWSRYGSRSPAGGRNVVDPGSSSATSRVVQSRTAGGSDVAAASRATSPRRDLTPSSAGSRRSNTAPAPSSSTIVRKWRTTWSRSSACRRNHGREPSGTTRYRSPANRRASNCAMCARSSANGRPLPVSGNGVAARHARVAHLVGTSRYDDEPGLVGSDGCCDHSFVIDLPLADRRTLRSRCRHRQLGPRGEASDALTSQPHRETPRAAQRLLRAGRQPAGDAPRGGHRLGARADVQGTAAPDGLLRRRREPLRRLPGAGGQLAGDGPGRRHRLSHRAPQQTPAPAQLPLCGLGKLVRRVTSRGEVTRRAFRVARRVALRRGPCSTNPIATSRRAAVSRVRVAVSRVSSSVRATLASSARITSARAAASARATLS